jgi:serine/threonine-protein kinase
MAKAAPFDTLLDQFEEAWQPGAVPRLEDFWSQAQRVAAPAAAQRDALIDLIKIDLHRRWKAAFTQRSGERPVLESYLKRFPALGPAAQLPVELIVEEYSARRCAGDPVAQDEYCRRFPNQAARLRVAFPRVDAELGPTPASTPPATDGSSEERLAPIESAQALLDRIVQLALLDARQLEQARRPQFRARFPDIDSLTRFLGQNGWLTPYQLEQLWLGKTHRLIVGPYILLDRLGEGATSVVFKARHRHLQRIVALKVIRKELLRDVAPDAVERLYQEFRAVGRLSHPHVVHAYDAGPVGSTLFIAMEYMAGANLLELVKQKGRLPPEQACDYVRQACAALHHAAENGIVHRDVKPSNLIVAGSPSTSLHPWGVLKLLDLGLARIHSLGQAHSSGMLTQKGAIIGTADYMAPEQALDAHGVDIRADLYSLGCTLYYLLAGRPPFVTGTFVQKLDKHRLEQPEPIERLCPGLPANIAAVAQRLLAKQPGERFQSPAELYVALGGNLAALPMTSASAETVSFSATLPGASSLPSAPPVPAVAAPLPRSFSSRRWLVPVALGIGLLVLVGVGLGIAALTRSRPAPEVSRAPAPVREKQEVLDLVLAIECGRKQGEVRLTTPNYGYKLINGAPWDQWKVLPPAKSYCWFHANLLQFQVQVPRRTAGVLRVHFFDGDSNLRAQRLFVQGRAQGEFRNFALAEKVVDVPITPDDTRNGLIDVKIERMPLSGANVVVSTVEFLERRTVSKNP